MGVQEASAYTGKRVLFIDRDGTLIKEVPPFYQVDSLDKVTFYPHVFKYMGKIAEELDYELVLVSNQDGLGTAVFTEEQFWPAHHLVMTSFANEDVVFSEELIDRSFPDDNLTTRKPGIGMFTKYLNNPDYDMPNSYVIGDRITDVQLAKNLHCKAIWLRNDPELGISEIKDSPQNLEQVIALTTTEWKDIYEFLKLGRRVIKHTRQTSETNISIEVNLDGSGKGNIQTGL